jgi:hypothetical protein
VPTWPIRCARRKRTACRRESWQVNSSRVLRHVGHCLTAHTASRARHIRIRAPARRLHLLFPAKVGRKRTNETGAGDPARRRTRRHSFETLAERPSVKHRGALLETNGGENLRGVVQDATQGRANNWPCAASPKRIGTPSTVRVRRYLTGDAMRFGGHARRFSSESDLRSPQGAWGTNTLRVDKAEKSAVLKAGTRTRPGCAAQDVV